MSTEEFLLTVQPPTPTAKELRKRDGNDCVHLTLTVKTGFRGLPSSCLSFFNTASTGLVTPVFVRPGKPDFTATLTIPGQPHNYDPIGNLPPDISAFLAQDLGVHLGPEVEPPGQPPDNSPPPKTAPPPETKPGSTSAINSTPSTTASPSKFTTGSESESTAGTAQESPSEGSLTSTSTSSVPGGSTSQLDGQKVTAISSSLSVEISTILQPVTTEISGQSTVITSAFIISTAYASSPSKDANSDLPDDSTSTSTASETSRHLNPGVIAGAVIGGILFIVIIVVIILHYVRKIRRRRLPPDSKFMIYAPSREKLMTPESGISSTETDESSGIIVTYSKAVFDDPLLAKVRETRRAYNDYRSGT